MLPDIPVGVNTGIAPDGTEYSLDDLVEQIPVARVTMDTTPCNHFGRCLLDMCHATGIVITNGRTKGDVASNYARTLAGLCLMMSRILLSPRVCNGPKSGRSYYHHT